MVDHFTIPVGHEYGTCKGLERRVYFESTNKRNLDPKKKVKLPYYYTSHLQYQHTNNT